MKTFVSKFFKWVLALGILGVAVFAIVVLVKTKPVPSKKGPEEILPEVEVTTVSPAAIAIEVPSQGMIMPRRRAMLASEVMGKIVEISPKFDAGEPFAKDEMIARIEDADYRASLAESKVALVQAEVELATEQARADQAKRDLKSLGRGEASDLTLRKPQLAAAEVRIESAKEAVAKAERDLERTTIRAPYDAILSSVQADLGSYVSPGMAIAEVYTPSPYEVRLPVSLDEFRFINRNKEGEPSGKVSLTTAVGNEIREWTGEIVRGEGEIERESRSIYIVAEVETKDALDSPVQLQPGLFVKAAVDGRTVEGLTRVPARAFLDLERVVVIDPEDKLQYRKVEVVRREDDSALISGGLEPTDRIVLTELSGRIPGMKVKPIVKEANASDEVSGDALTRSVKP